MHAGLGDHEARVPGFVVQPPLQDARELGARDHEVGELVKDQRAPPARGGRLVRDPLQEGIPGRVSDLLKPVKSRREGLRDVARWTSGVDGSATV